MKSDEQARAYSPSDWRKLSQYNAEQVANYLPATLDFFHDSYDLDRPMYLGVALARASYDELDVVAVRWLSEQPSELRLRIVAAFLSGLWHPRIRKKPIRCGEVDEMIRIRRRVVVEAGASYDAGLPGLWDAFEGKAASHEVKERIAEVLREVQKAPGAPSGFIENVQKLLEGQGFG